MSFDKAKELLKKFKGNTYIHGINVLHQIGDHLSAYGSQVVLIRDGFPGSESYVEIIINSLKKADVNVLDVIKGAQPNAPRDDLHRITDNLLSKSPNYVISFGGGSTIDSVKAAEILRTLGGNIEDYFGVGLVTKKIENCNIVLKPHVAIQSAASSGAHLTKYSNITNIETGQKKLIVDEAIIPIQPVFDYAVTTNAPMDLTLDGAMDGFSHSLEVLYGSVRKPYSELAERIARESMGLIIKHLPEVQKDPSSLDQREALGLATDLGGYAIMVGGTNGGHLTSFSLVDVLSHGRASALLNPYYTVFFAPVIEKPLRVVAEIFTHAGFSSPNLNKLHGRDLGMAIAELMFTFSEKIGFPTSLDQVPGFSDKYIERAITAAKDPQLKMKLENMPIPLDATMVDEYMRPILEAATAGDLTLIKNITSS